MMTSARGEKSRERRKARGNKGNAGKSEADRHGAIGIGLFAFFFTS